VGDQLSGIYVILQQLTFTKLIVRMRSGRSRHMLKRVACAIGAAVMLVVIVGCAPAGDQPSTTPTQEGLSLSPRADQAYRCLVDKGWPVTISWDGGVDITSDDVPAGQEERYDQDAEACWAPLEEMTRDLSQEGIEELYEEELATRECLIAEGYQVDDPPSKQRFLDSYPDERWMAYGASDVTRAMADEESWRAINETCRQPSWTIGF